MGCLQAIKNNECVFKLAPAGDASGRGDGNSTAHSPIRYVAHSKPNISDRRRHRIARRAHEVSVGDEIILAVSGLRIGKI